MTRDHGERLIKDVFDEINLPNPDLTENVKEGINMKRTAKKVSPIRAAAMGIAAVMVLCVLVSQTPTMVSYAKEHISSWFNVISTSQEQVKMEGTYHSLKSTACKTENRYQTMDEIEDMLGANILQSPLAYEGAERLIQYSPDHFREG